MSESVIIEGYNIPKNEMPDWASETTLESIEEEAKKHGVMMSRMVEFLGRIARGENIKKTHYKAVMDEMRKQRKTNTDSLKQITTEIKETSEKQNKSTFGLQRTMNKNLGILAKELMGLNQIEQANSKKFDKMNENLKAAGMDGGMADALTGQLDKFSKFAGKLGPVAFALDKAIKGIMAVHAANQFVLGAIEERFNAVNELRQSGIFAGFKLAGENLNDFAKNVGDQAFTLGEAVEMTNKFSNAVGVYGVQRSMEFVNNLAFNEDYIGRFGASFGQVINLAGEFLDYQRNLGQLSTLDDARRNAGMADFMDAVISTSNVLKISLEDSAKLIKDTLSGDTFAGMIATTQSDLPPELVNAIGQMANMFGPVGEIVAMGALDPNRFVLTEQFQQLNNPAMQEMRPAIESMIDEIRAGVDPMTVVSRYGSQLGDIIKNSDFISTMSAMDIETRKMAAAIVQFAETSDQAAAGLLVGDADQEVSRFTEEQRQLASVMERAVSNLVAAMNLDEVMEKQRIAYDNLTTSLDNFAETLAPTVANIMETTLNAEAVVINGAAIVVDAGTATVNALTGTYNELEAKEYLQGAGMFNTGDITRSGMMHVQKVTPRMFGADITPLTEQQKEENAIMSAQFDNFLDSLSREITQTAAQRNYSGGESRDYFEIIQDEMAQNFVSVGMGGVDSTEMAAILTSGDISQRDFRRESDAFIDTLSAARTAQMTTDAAITELLTKMETDQQYRTELKEQFGTNANIDILVAEIRRLIGAVQ